MGLKVYPNPFEESLFIELPEAAHVQVTTVEGKVIIEKYLPASNWINLDVNAGMYLLKIFKDDRVYIQLIMKK